MLKAAFTIIFGIFFSSTLLAQKKADTVVYYLKNSGKVVSSKDSADYFRIILPPDTSIDKNLFIVRDYYPTGKTRLIAGSLTNKLNLKLQGPYILYFPNGHKKMVGSFENGEASGNIVEYYPNGRVYNIKTYQPDKTLTLTECHDSTGTVLAENGNGEWIRFSDNFSKILEKGKIVNGNRDSVWDIAMTDSTGFVKTYVNGRILATQPAKISGDKFFVSVETVPEFPGGINEFGMFLSRMIRYPSTARDNGTQGRVIISFVVEKDGTLTNIKVTRGIGDGCDEEAVRVIKLCPPWKPGMQNGKPVRVAYSVPISFTLEGRSGFISH